MNQCPFTIGADPDCNGFHIAQASTESITWEVVHMLTVETEGTVVAVCCSECGELDEPATPNALEVLGCA
jgi:hypothetical protein